MDKQASVWNSRWIWPLLLTIWFILISWLPDPRPLGAPDRAVQAIQKLAGTDVQLASLIASGLIRGSGLAFIGILIVPCLTGLQKRWALPLTLVGAPVLAILSLWINYSFFPLNFQTIIAVSAAIMGVFIGWSVLKTRWALIPLLLFPIALFSWGTSTGISDEFFELARETGLHILEEADDIPSGDEGFVKLIEVAFSYAEKRSDPVDPVEANRAAIIALSAIIGEEKVARIAKREISLARIEESKKLRSRITIHGRHDLPRHFWVSAGLSVLSGSERSMAVGIGKEMMDSAGGSGFSFVDLTADRAGTLFFLAATKDPEAARSMQIFIRNGTALEDYMPQINGLPEGINNVNFQQHFGGLRGTKTIEWVEEIKTRLTTCSALFPQ